MIQVKENLISFCYIRLPRLPLEMWNGNILRKILKPVGKLCKLDPNSEELYKALFARVCLEVDISKLLKMKIQYIRSGLVYDCLVDYENITTIFYGYGSQNHKFDACSLNSKSMAFRIERLQEQLQTEGLHSHIDNGKSKTQEAKWIFRPRRKQSSTTQQGKSSIKN